MGLMVMMVLSALLHSQCTASTEYHSTVDDSSSTSDPTFSTTQKSYSDENFTTILPVSGCDIDFTSCTTELVNVTTLEPGNLKNTTKKSTVSHKGKSLGFIDYCTCDLQLNLCDINCCCDEECSSEDKQIFDHCEAENRVYDTKYCEYMKYIYINNTPFEWKINQNGLFCVVKSNSAPFYIIQRKHALKTFREAQNEKTKPFSWRECTITDQTRELMNATTENFRYGNHISVIQNGKLEKFRLPNKFITNRCLIQDDVLNLKNIKNTCVQDVISEDNQYLSMREYFEDIYVVASPSSFNITKYNRNKFGDCPRNVCMPILPKVCDEHFNGCVNITKNETRIKVTCSFIQSKNVCVNLVQKLRYEFYHNGTSGFTQIILLAYLENATHHFWKKDLEFTQEFSVNFWWANQTRNYSEMLSGNPGYLVGKPILVGKLVNVGNETHELLSIQRNSSRFTDNFLTVPESRAGNCVSDEVTHVVVEFGYDQLTKCKYRGYVGRKKKVNGTEMCRDIQRSVFKLWNVSERENSTFGSFGNANRSAPNDWLKILYEKDPQSILNGTGGTYNSKTNLLSCFGIATCWNIDLFHSKIDVGSLQNQEKLLAVTYSFGIFVNRTIFLNKNAGSAFFELDLRSLVTFYDISKPKVKKMLDPPSLDIKLPYDFFYPFVKIGNGSENPTYSLITLISIIVVVFNQ